MAVVRAATGIIAFGAVCSLGSLAFAVVGLVVEGGATGWSLFATFGVLGAAVGALVLWSRGPAGPDDDERHHQAALAPHDDPLGCDHRDHLALAEALRGWADGDRHRHSGTSRPARCNVAG